MRQAANNEAIFFFFLSFIAVAGLILMSVFFAVLLDEFGRSYLAERQQQLLATEELVGHLNPKP